MPTVLALAGAEGSAGPSLRRQGHLADLGGRRGHRRTKTTSINVEAFRGAIRKGNWKLVKIALLPGKTELFDLSKDPGETAERGGSVP